MGVKVSGLKCSKQKLILSYIVVTGALFAAIQTLFGPGVAVIPIQAFTSKDMMRSYSLQS